jgi:hypothetical protein
LDGPVVEEIHLTSLSGIGASYRLKGYFKIRSAGAPASKLRVSFKGIAFGGLYGGHNVNLELSPKARRAALKVLSAGDEKALEDLISEVQRKIMQGDMVVDFEKIKPDSTDLLGNVTG